MTSTNPRKKMSDKKGHVLRGSIFLSLSPVASLVLGFWISVLITRYITTESYSIFSWFTMMNSILVTLIPLQLYTAIGRYLAISKGEENEENLNRLLKTNLVLTLILVPITAIVTFIVTSFVFTYVLGLGGQFNLLDILVFTLAIVVTNISLFMTSASSGLQEFRKLGIAQFFANTLAQVAVILLIIYGLGITALILKWVLVSVFTTIILLISLREISSLKGRIYPLRPLISFSLPANISFIFIFFFNEVLIRIIFQSFPSELGLYQFAVRITTYVVTFTLGYYSATGPHLTQALGEGGSKQLENEMRWTMKVAFFIFLPLIIGVMIIAPALFLILFHTLGYYWSYRYFLILMIQPVLFLFYRPYYRVLIAEAKTNLLLVISVSSAIVSGLLMFLLMPFGLYYVVIGYVSNTLISTMLLAIWIKRVEKISLHLRHVMPFLIIACSMIIPAVIIHLLRFSPIIEIGLIVGVSALVYFIPIRLLNLISENEIKKASLLLPKRFATPITNFLIWFFVKKSNRGD